MDRILQGVAVILVGLAAYFVWNGNNDGAFVSAVLGCVAFFLSIRARMKERTKQTEEETERAAAIDQTSEDERSARD